MFIEKLTDEQITIYLKSKYPNYKISFTRDKSSIRAYITNTKSRPDDYSWYETYFDFDTTSAYPSHWVKYLYKIFGEEYKKAYLDDCAKIFD